MGARSWIRNEAKPEKEVEPNIPSSLRGSQSSMDINKQDHDGNNRHELHSDAFLPWPRPYLRRSLRDSFQASGMRKIIPACRSEAT